MIAGKVQATFGITLDELKPGRLRELLESVSSYHMVSDDQDVTIIDALDGLVIDVEVHEASVTAGMAKGVNTARGVVAHLLAKQGQRLPEPYAVTFIDDKAMWRHMQAAQQMAGEES